jgi:integrase/recombinase XerD
MNFETYLRTNGNAPSSVKNHIAEIKRYEAWIAEEQLDINQINYRELLGYIQGEKSKNLKTQTINLRLNSITKYYNYLIEEGVRTENPARKLRVKGTKKTVLKDQLKAEELQQLYEQYKNREYFREEKHKPTHKRNTIILSLMINQALHTGELKRLEVSHLNFDKGEIYIPSTKRSNSRTLKLHAGQIIPMHTYVLQTREQLEITGDFLFKNNLNNNLQYILGELQGINPMIRNVGQIRASVIMNWIKHHNIREVQYYAGHKHISSTEKYRQQEVETLQKSLEKYHPLEN